MSSTSTRMYLHTRPARHFDDSRYCKQRNNEYEKQTVPVNFFADRLLHSSRSPPAPPVQSAQVQQTAQVEQEEVYYSDLQQHV